MPTLKHFMQQQPQVSYLIEDFLPSQSLVMISGDPGAGKSWILIQTAIAVAQGGSLFGKFKASQGSVLYIDRDSPEAITWQRFHELKVDSNLPILIETDPTFILDTKMGQKKIEQLITSLKPKLVILETLSTLTTDHFDENKTKTVKPVLNFLKTLRDNHDLAIIVSHHFRKKKGSYGSASSWLRGSSTLPSNFDVIYGIWNLPYGDSKVIGIYPFPKRFQLTSAFKIKFVSGRGWIWDSTWNPEEMLDAHLLYYVSKVLEYLEDCKDQGMTVKEIMEASENLLSDYSIRKILRYLMCEGLIREGKERHNRSRFYKI